MTDLTQREIAEHLDMSERNVRDVLQRLGIDHKTTSLDEIRVAYIRLMREQAAGRGGEDQYDLAKQRARQASVDADLKELEYYERIGGLVAVADLEPLLADWAAHARSEVENAVDRIVTAVESKHGIEIERATVDAPLDAAFTAIAGYPTSAAGDDGPGGGEVDAAA